MNDLKSEAFLCIYMVYMGFTVYFILGFMVVLHGCS